MYKYMIIDYTDKETLYFESIEEVEDYCDTWNHDILVRVRTLSSWQDFRIYDRMKGRI